MNMKKRFFFEALRGDRSRKVALHMSPWALYVTGMSIGWPDVDLPDLVARGGNIVGEIPPTGIFRQKLHDPLQTVDELLRDANDWIDQLQRSPAPPDDKAQVAFDESLREQGRGWMSEWLCKEDLDKRFGKGAWVPMQ
eukprot:12402992-Karenia_brevis.AAC.1